MTETNDDNLNNEFVVLMHGILRSKIDMMPMSMYFQHKGYTALNILYPSREKSLEELTEFVHEKITNCPHYETARKMHFVTHSMGSLIARYYIKTYEPKILGHVVMLGPPNTGSEFADWLDETKIFSPFFKKFYGPAGQQLKTTHQHIDQDINYPIGVIAGNVSINPLAPWVLPGEHDGIVPVKRTKIDGMTDHIVMPATHSFMMFNKHVMQQAAHFLANGEFDHEADVSPEDSHTSEQEE